MTEEEKELMTAWNLRDPVSDWEKDLNARIDEDLGDIFENIPSGLILFPEE